MVEETQNQQPFKRIKVEEEDRISLLPDCLIIDEILSRLESTKQAIRTGSLSKRWQHLWPYVPVLVFQESSFDFFRCVNKTINQCRQTKLNKFKLILYSKFGFESHVRSWIHYAIRCNVEEFDLDLKYCVSVLDDLFYTAPSFTHIKLNTYIFNLSTAISWVKLKSLHILNADLDKDLIQNILSGSPLLETLKLNTSISISSPLHITSKSLKKLVLSNFFCNVKYDPDIFKDIIVINAPNLLSITIKDYMWLSKLLLLNVSSLVKAKLDYENYWHTDREAKEDMLKGLLVSLRHVKEVNIGRSCFKTLCCLKAEGFIPPSNLKLPMNEVGFL